MRIKARHILILIIFSGFVFSTGCASSETSNNSSLPQQVTTVRTTYPSVPIGTFYARTQTTVPTPKIQYNPLFVIINPVNRWYYPGYVFELNGTTNLDPDDKLRISIFEGIHPTPYGYHYTTQGINKYVKIQPGTSGVNTWSVSVNLTDYPKRCYWIWVTTEYHLVHNETSFFICNKSFSPTKCDDMIGSWCEY